MKVIVLMLLLVSSVGVKHHQKITEFLYLDMVKNTTIELEKISPDVKFALKGTERMLTVTLQGKEASVKFKRKSAHQFFFQWKVKRGLELKNYSLVKLKRNKKTRTFTIQEVANKARSVFPTLIPCTAESQGENTALITTKDLPSGEYAFISNDVLQCIDWTEERLQSCKFYAFSIEGPSLRASY